MFMHKIGKQNEFCYDTYKLKHNALQVKKKTFQFILHPCSIV